MILEILSFISPLLEISREREREENNRNCESRIEGREDGEEKDR